MKGSPHPDDLIADQAEEIEVLRGKLENEQRAHKRTHDELAAARLLLREITHAARGT